MVKRRKAKPPEANKAEDINLPQLAEFATALQEHKEVRGLLCRTFAPRSASGCCLHKAFEDEYSSDVEISSYS